MNDTPTVTSTSGISWLRTRRSRPRSTSRPTAAAEIAPAATPSQKFPVTATVLDGDVRVHQMRTRRARGSRSASVRTQGWKPLATRKSSDPKLSPFSSCCRRNTRSIHSSRPWPQFLHL